MVMAPFKLDGGLWFAAPADNHPNLVWEETQAFEAELRVVGFNKTARGSFFLLIDEENNSSFPMNSEQMSAMLLKTIVEDGYVEGRWDVIQRNNKFSLRFLEELVEQ